MGFSPVPGAPFAARRGERRQPTWADPNRRLLAPGIKARSWGVPHALSLSSTLFPTPADANALSEQAWQTPQWGSQAAAMSQARQGHRRTLLSTHALPLASWQRLRGQRLLGSRGRGRRQGPYPRRGRNALREAPAGSWRSNLHLQIRRLSRTVPEPQRCAHYRRCSRTASAQRQQAQQR